MAELFPAVPDLTRVLGDLLRQVPAGRVTTCGDLAEALGNRIAARWVGHFALHHDHRPQCLCHRIVRVGGELGGYAAGSIEAKARLLGEEGVVVRQGLIDLERFGFREFVSDRPWSGCGRSKRPSSGESCCRPADGCQSSSAASTWPIREPEVGVAAYALVETHSGKLVWSTTVRRRVAFPYISTYLSFREIPILLELLAEVRAAGRMAEIVLVDGSGILHHRHAGIASHLGVVASLADDRSDEKTALRPGGRADMAPGESRPVVHEDQLIGVALRPTAGSLRPIFLSPGHRVDVAFCERLVRRLLTGRRLPEPIYWADRLSRT